MTDAEKIAELERVLSNLLAIENKNWPAYIRTAFAEARVVLNRVATS